MCACSVMQVSGSCTNWNCTDAELGEFGVDAGVETCSRPCIVWRIWFWAQELSKLRVCDLFFLVVMFPEWGWGVEFDFWAGLTVLWACIGGDYAEFDCLGVIWMLWLCFWLGAQVLCWWRTLFCKIFETARQRTSRDVPACISVIGGLIWPVNLLVRYWSDDRRPINDGSKGAQRFLRLVFLGSMNLNISFRTKPVWSCQIPRTRPKMPAECWVRTGNDPGPLQVLEARLKLRKAMAKREAGDWAKQIRFLMTIEKHQ